MKSPQSEGVKTIAVPMPRNPSPARHSVALLRLVSYLACAAPRHRPQRNPSGVISRWDGAWTTGVPVRVKTLHGIGTEAVAGRMRPVFHFLERLSCRAAERIYPWEIASAHRPWNWAWPPLISFASCRRGTCNGIESRAVFTNAGRVASGRVAARAVGITSRCPRHRICRADGAIQGGRRPDRGIQAAPSRVSWAAPLVGRTLRGLRTARSGTLCRDHPRSAKSFRPVSSKILPSVYPLMNVLALPSYREGYGYVLMEAAAMQLPTVATRIVGCVDAVIDGVTGSLVPPGNVDALAAAIRAYLFGSGAVPPAWNGRAASGSIGTSARSRFGNRFIRNTWSFSKG